MTSEQVEKIFNELSSIKRDVALMNQKLDSNHKAFRDSETEWKIANDRIVEEIYGKGETPGLRSKVKSLELVPKMLKDHSNVDLWGFGTVSVIGMTILGWVVFKH